MKDQTLYDQAMYEVIAIKRDFRSNLGTFTDLEKACLAIHAHLYENDNYEFRYFVNVYNYSYTLEHKLGGCKHEG